MMRYKRPGHIILRTRKALSRSDWNGNFADSKTPADIMSFVKHEGVRAVVLDSPPTCLLRHNDLLRQAIHHNPEAWSLA
jgi:hypothetical protein